MIDKTTTTRKGYLAAMPIESLWEQVKRIQDELNALVMAVATVHPNESRYETALRYITERETPSTECADCAAECK